MLGGLIYGLMNLRIVPEQNLRNAAPVSKGFQINSKTKVTIDKPLLKLELPVGWHEISTDKKVAATPTYSFASPSADAQIMDIYIDAVPTTMAVNKAVVVSAQADGLGYDTVSDNCTNFTESSLKDPRTATAPARWQTINFICDMGNYARAVVGTMSTEGINQVTVTGPTTGPHKLFITYTDNNISPSYSVLYEILRSIHFK